VVGAFTSRFLFFSPLVSGPSAGATEIGEAEMGSEVASVPEDDRQLVGSWPARLAFVVVLCWKSHLHRLSMAKG